MTTEIVNVIETHEEIREEFVCFNTLSFATKLDVLQYVAKKQLIANHRQCTQCNTEMKLQTRGNSDGYVWYCGYCRAIQSVRNGSFFHLSRLPLEKCLKVIYGWSRDYSQKMIRHECQLGLANTKTTVEWCNFCREACQVYLDLNPVLLGGLDEANQPTVVEIGESEFFPRKGTVGAGRWVFGGIERETGKCFLVDVPDRTRETLLHQIQRYILPGTRIVSDERRAYQGIDTIGGGIYIHDVVLQKHNFVDPQHPDIHTRNIEDMWMRMKTKLRRQFGTSEELFPTYLSEFMWRNEMQRNSTNMYAEFLICLQQQYVFN